MASRTDIFELGRLGLGSGEGRRLELHAAIEPLEFGGQTYKPIPNLAPVMLDAGRTTLGWSLRLRFEVRLSGPCTRCLAEAASPIAVDAREVDQPGGGEELRSPYLDGDDLDVRAWARDALALALPAQILCREDCLGLCPVCGEDLNEAEPGHVHERAPDPRWAKLSELRRD
jgi:uncharacterized protein